MPKERKIDTATPEGSVVGWDICGNPTCHRHISISKLADCPSHPVAPAYISKVIAHTFKDGK